MMVKWFEIPVNDMKRASSFYEQVFAVELQPLELANGLKMSLFPEEADSTSGALCYYPDFYKTGTQGPLIYLSAEPSIDKVLSRVVEAGGKVVIPKNQISPERGFMAVFEDTEGNRVALNSKL
jgi:predicted enzyme related to lactoylglutathione lyase